MNLREPLTLPCGCRTSHRGRMLVLEPCRADCPIVQITREETIAAGKVLIDQTRKEVLN